MLGAVKTKTMLGATECIKQSIKPREAEHE